MMDTPTQQLAHKVAIGLAAVMVLGSFIFMLAVAWQQGDGPAREMVSLLQPTVIGVMGGLLGYLGINTMVNGWVAVKTAGTVAQIPAEGVSPVSVPVSVPATVATAATAAVAPVAAVAVPAVPAPPDGSPL